MGVDIETLQAGDGANFPRPGNKVECHYVLTLTNGTKVDSSRDRGQPFSFNLGKGEVRLLTIKSLNKGFHPYICIDQILILCLSLVIFSTLLNCLLSGYCWMG